MLISPRDEFIFAKDVNTHKEYFQTVPISRMIVSDYEAVHLTEVMLQDGTLLTDHDPGEADGMKVQCVNRLEKN